MIPPPSERPLGQGWLIPFADLALILFVITSAGLVSASQAHDASAEAEPQTIGEGIATAVFTDGAGAPPLADWLDSHTLGGGEQLTIMCRYRLRENRSALAVRCEQLAQLAIAQGHTPRLIVQQGAQRAVLAYFAHDGDPAMARNLQSEAQT